MALTGTPLINDIEDFRAIWQFLGWIDETEPRAELMDALEETGLTPADPGLLPRRPPVRDRPRHRPPPQGRRGRRHPGPPHRRPARRTRRQGRPLDPRGRARPRAPAGGAVRRPRWPTAEPAPVEGIDHDLVRKVATWEQKDANSDRDRRERVQHDAAHRPGEGRPRRRLRGAARAQRRQGRLLRQAHRRHGHRRGGLHQAGDPLLLDPRRPDADGRGRRTSTPSSTIRTSPSRSVR